MNFKNKRHLFIEFSYSRFSDLKFVELGKLNLFSFKIFIFAAEFCTPWTLLPGAAAPLALRPPPHPSQLRRC
jgi:hypothetical protein